MGDEVRITYSAEKAEATTRSFVRFYWTLAAGIALVAVLFQPQLIGLAIAFPIMLGIWQWRITRAPRHPWELVIAADEIVSTANGKTVRVERAAAGEVRFRRRQTRGAAWTELGVTGHNGKYLLQVGFEEAAKDEILSGLTRHDWPLEDR